MLALVLLAAAAPTGADGLDSEFEGDHYMTDARARKIVEQKLPESQAALDKRLQVIKGTSYFQVGKIDRMIPIALLNENGDVTLAEAVPGMKQTKPISLMDCAHELEKFAQDKEKDLASVSNATQKLKGTIVDFQLIDDMANDPSHPWIHSATYNKTSVSRKTDAVAAVLQSWIESMNKALIQATHEYIPPFNTSLVHMEPHNRPPPHALAWIEQYTQSSRIILVAAGLLRKFSARGMAEGVRVGTKPLAVPMNAKDWMDVAELAARKVAQRAQQAIRHEQREGGKLHGLASSLIESSASEVQQHYATVSQNLGALKRVVIREKEAMKKGFLPKASALLLAYGKAVQALNDASNVTRAALKLPPARITQRKSLGEVYEAILRGDMATHFYGKKLGPNETLADWGVSVHTDHDGTISFESSFTESEGQKQYHKLREAYEERTPGYTAYDETKTNKILYPPSLFEKHALKTPKLDKLYEELTHQHPE